MNGDNHHLRIESLDVVLGKFALRGVDLTCDRGEYHILMGPNGSGKSSLMKTVLGFHKVEKGAIFVGDREITHELPERRRMGYVPQNYALFPHLNVERNLRFGIQARHRSSQEADALVDELSNILGINHLRTRDVRHLSGGERQRVALGRALGSRPETVLMDEPFSAVDEGGKRELWYELKRIIEGIGITALHITHNFEEAYALGERLSVLVDGRLVQSGGRREIFEHPATERVARYLNYRNIFTGTARKHDAGTRIETDNFDIVVPHSLPLGETVQVCVRQSDIKVIKHDQPVRDFLQRNLFSGKIVRLFPMTEHCLLWFRIDGSNREYDFELRFPRHIKARYRLEQGQQARVAFAEPAIIILE